jgi:hypothetical protein
VFGAGVATPLPRLTLKRDSSAIMAILVRASGQIRGKIALLCTLGTGSVVQQGQGGVARHPCGTTAQFQLQHALSTRIGRPPAVCEDESLGSGLSSLANLLRPARFGGIDASAAPTEPVWFADWSVPSGKRSLWLSG